MSSQAEPRVAIIGAGMAGLVLAMALKKHVGIAADVYEQAPRFDQEAGGAIGLYPNGLRVLNDISPRLLQSVRQAAYPYLYRRWMRHDGSQVACADESVLCEGIDGTDRGTLVTAVQDDSNQQQQSKQQLSLTNNSNSGGMEDQDQFASVGIRRWRLQKVLCDGCTAMGIEIKFSKRLRAVETAGPTDQRMTLEFEDNTRSSVAYDVIFGADGVKSRVRDNMFGQMEVAYTGITCLMGASPMARPFRGICFPSSSTTRCHACYYPTGENEQIFQIYFPTEERPETWGNLSPEEARKECLQLADRLQADGWHRDFVDPIKNSHSVIRVGLRAREPLKKWVLGRRVLLGDAAHPPVPYIGQGAMMALEDAGTLALLLKGLCMERGRFSMRKFDTAMAVYEELRIDRVRDVLGASKALGATQQNRAESALYNWAREWGIWMQVKFYGTLPIMFKGASFDYARAVSDRLKVKSML